MAEIAVEPYVLKNCVMEIDEDDYAAALSGVVFTPSSSQVTFQGLKPAAQFSDITPATWTCDLNYAQDLETATSLTHYLHAHEGEAVEAVFVPIDGDAGQPKVTATIIITPGALGGQGRQYATSSVKLGVKGKPALGVTS